ncbi:sensor histidine kinase [Sulfuriroseicoccus oceanibius]|uniref:histidine kinase n=1 Tax=Sulfuriroseicoccus oceanibius TaxID=2707525 RepID=A0A6B3LD48_9BACT|nr:ATP-binding protein [Sulfuriroseicoccus oceanibius]QQL44985.1 hypothetical protein G3M56_014160 [Sulfuriroseicoccus oceanibius]
MIAGSPIDSATFVIGLLVGGAIAALFRWARETPENKKDTKEERQPARPSDQVNFTTLSETLDLLQEAVMLVDPDDLAVVYANKRCDRFFRTSNEITGRPLLDVCRSHQLLELTQKAITSGSSVKEKLGAAEDDSRFWTVYITLGTSPKPEDPSAPKPLVRIVIRDDTEQIRTEQIRREFIANASHELRTPITIISGYIDNLLDGAINRPELATKFLKVARKHSHRTNRLIEDMLTISKLESGQIGQITSERFSLARCAEHVIDQLQPIIDAQSATVTIETDPESEFIVGDRFYWDQIIFNLTENALKNNPTQPIDVKISTRIEDEHHVVEVTDNGVGIPLSSQPFIFKRFYRVQKDHSQTIKGTGLGLSIVKRAVEAHGGSIEVDSVPHQHTTFRVLLPHTHTEESAPPIS